MAHDLGGVKKADGAGGAKAVELELPDASSEASNRFYQGVLESFHGGMQKKPQGSSSISTEDSYKLFRTNVVLAWLFSNLAIIIVFTNPTVVAKTTTSFCRRSTGFEECDKSQVTGQDVVLFSFNGYVSFLFYASAFFALVKFIGTIYYLIVQQAFDRKSDANDTHIGNVLAKKPDF